MTVYVITEGEYSDRSIERVFLSREKAEIYCKYHKGAFIWEFETADDTYIPYKPQKCVRAEFRIEKNNNGTYTTKLMRTEITLTETTNFTKEESYLSDYGRGPQLELTRYYDEKEKDNDLQERIAKIGYDLCSEIIYMLTTNMSIKDICESRGLINW